MNNLRLLTLSIIFIFIVLCSACTALPAPDTAEAPDTLQFSGARAFQLESEFATQFTGRHSGTGQSLRSTEWIRTQFENAGWRCTFDDWEVINYSRPLPLRNVVCRLQGEDPLETREILIVAHHDQAPTTIEGADNDGAGIAILIHLAEVFSGAGPLPYSLVFVATDGEEYGMLGTARFMETHLEPERIIAGVSLDNVGRNYYDRMTMELIGRHDGYGPIWLALAVREAAKAAGGNWEVILRNPIDQVLDQAVPVSFMDQGPLVAAGVPGIGLAGGYPSEYSDLHYGLWHSPDDTMAYQSTETLGNVGLIVEALIRQLLAKDSFPAEKGPYIYLDASGQVLRGTPLYLIFTLFTAVLFAGSYFSAPHDNRQDWTLWRGALVHFLGYWLPLVFAILMLYGFVKVGILLDYHIYPATTKDPELLNPDWQAIFLFLLGLAAALFAGRFLARKYLARSRAIPFIVVKSLAFLVIGIVGVYILMVNPFSLIFLVPVLAWLLIAGRHGVGKILDILFFLIGGLLVYALVYFFGFVILRYGFAFLWMFLNMFSSGTITFGAALAGTAVLAAGLAVLTGPANSRVK